MNDFFLRIKSIQKKLQKKKIIIKPPHFLKKVKKLSLSYDKLRVF